MKSGFQSLLGSSLPASEAVMGESAAMVLSSNNPLEAAKNIEVFFDKNPEIINGAKSIINSNETTKALLTDISKTIQSGKSDLFRIFPESFKKFAPELAKLDKSVLETSAGRNIIAKLGGKIKFISDGKAAITGNTTAKFAGTTLAKIPLLGILVASTFELPEIIKAFKNGHGAEQVIKSAINVGCATLGAAIGATMFAAIPPFGGVLGAVIGGVIGDKIGHWIGNHLPKKPLAKLASWGMAELMLQLKQMFFPV